MRRFLIVVYFLLTTAVHAQTSTPTVSPPYSEAFYEFENLSAPSAQISGGSTTTYMNRTVLVLSSTGSVRFSTNAAYLVIYYNSSASIGSVTMTVSVNNVPKTTIQVFDTEVYGSSWYDLGGVGTKEILITRSPGTIQLYLDYMVLLNGSMIAAPTATPGATPTAITPTPFVIFIPQPVTPSVATATPTPLASVYFEVTETPDGAVGGYVENVITAGDMIITVFLVMVSIGIFALLGVVIWRR